MGRPVQRWLDRYQEQRPLEDRGAARFVHGSRCSETQRSVRGRTQGPYLAHVGVEAGHCSWCRRPRPDVSDVGFARWRVHCRVKISCALKEDKSATVLPARLPLLQTKREPFFMGKPKNKMERKVFRGAGI